MTLAASSFFAASARIPVPVPRSSSAQFFSGERTRGACAPQLRVICSSKRNDIAVVTCSPLPNAEPAGITRSAVLFLLVLVLEETITRRFPILIGWVVCACENIASQLRGSFSIVPPKRERTYSRSRLL